MSNPAFVLPGDRFTDSTFGTTAFGTTAFGGSGYDPSDAPALHLGSDDLTQSYRKRAGEIVHKRHGIPISVRKFAIARRWAVRHNVITVAQIADLLTYFEARTFQLLPTGTAASSIDVHWVGEDFYPIYIAPGKYSISYEIEEMI